MRLSIISTIILLLSGQAQASIAPTAATRVDPRSSTILPDAGTIELQPGADIQLSTSPAISGTLPVITTGGEITVFGSPSIVVSQDPLDPSPLMLDIHSSIPEPEAWAMLAAGLGLLGLHRRKRH